MLSTHLCRFAARVHQLLISYRKVQKYALPPDLQAFLPPRFVGAIKYLADPLVSPWSQNPPMMRPCHTFIMLGQFTKVCLGDAVTGHPRSAARLINLGQIRHTRLVFLSEQDGDDARSRYLVIGAVMR